MRLYTNDHVVQPGQPLTVMVDSATRVRAQVLSRDEDADLAVLRVHPDVCRDCPSLALAPFDTSQSAVVPGDHVVAIGYPLSQRSTVTSGIVSSLRERAIMADINLNPGNSGGPLLDMRGRGGSEHVHRAVGPRTGHRGDDPDFCCAAGSGDVRDFGAVSVAASSKVVRSQGRGAARCLPLPARPYWCSESRVSLVRERVAAEAREVGTGSHL